MGQARKSLLFLFFRLIFLCALSLQTVPALAEVPEDFGLPNGTRAQGTSEALRAIDSAHPGDVEIYLSYAATRRRIGGNPFGHVALRIGDTVYTANQNAVRGEDPQILIAIPADEYLYGVKPPTRNALPGSNYGVAYARSTVGLRIGGVTDEQKKKMLAAIANEEAIWQAGQRPFHWSRNNCVNFTDRILRAGGIKVQTEPSPVLLPTDFFMDALNHFTRQPGMTTSVIGYERLPSPNPLLRFTRLPITPHRPGFLLESAWRWLTGASGGSFGGLVTAAIAPVAGSTSVQAERRPGPAQLSHRHPSPGQRFDRTFGLFCKQGFSFLAEAMR